MLRGPPTRGWKRTLGQARPKREGAASQAENAGQMAVTWEARVHKRPLSAQAAHGTTLRVFTVEKKRCGNQSPSRDKIKALSK